MQNEKKVVPTIVSIFSGCGGLDLGFHMEGYRTIWANDFAEWAVASFRENLRRCHSLWRHYKNRSLYR